MYAHPQGVVGLIWKPPILQFFFHGYRVLMGTAVEQRPQAKSPSASAKPGASLMRKSARTGIIGKSAPAASNG